MVSTLPATPEAFIDYWTRAEANERANSQASLLGLTHLLGVPPPSNSHADGYSFEYPVTAADLSKHFTSTKPAALQQILESLAALGRARGHGERFAV